jgi:hypothetical protein
VRLTLTLQTFSPETPAGRRIRKGGIVIFRISVPITDRTVAPGTAGAVIDAQGIAAAIRAKRIKAVNGKNAIPRLDLVKAETKKRGLSWE